MKNRKSIIALLLVAIIGIVGLTVAYFSNSTSITNEFETSEYGTDVTETFTSPTGWQPGDETPKVLTVKNTGEVDEAVRIKVEEKWVNKNGDELPLEQDGNVAAQVHYINSSDWTKVDVANANYYYYYYNYKLAPDEETSELLDKVTFNPLINASTTCTTTTENGVTTKSCKSNGSGYDGATYMLIFTIETVQYNKYASAWNVDIVIAEEKPFPKLASEYLVDNATNVSTITSYNDENADKGKMFTFTHGTGENEVTETRYIGDEPDNYVYFNCDNSQDGVEYNYDESCEVWRIVGVFDVEKEIIDPENTGQKKTITEKRVKLVRGSLIKNMAWNPSGSPNEWQKSEINNFLNGNYYNGLVEDGLKSSAREMIDYAIFKLGEHTNAGSTESLYYSEIRGSKWQGKVGLMYPTDVYMVYGGQVSNNCYTNPFSCSSTNAQTGWIYNSNLLTESDPSTIWLMMYYNGFNPSAFYCWRTGGLYMGSVSNVYGVRPVVYLSADVQIFDGDGSEQNPYKLQKTQ